MILLVFICFYKISSIFQFLWVFRFFYFVFFCTVVGFDLDVVMIMDYFLSCLYLSFEFYSLVMSYTLSVFPVLRVLKPNTLSSGHYLSALARSRYLMSLVVD